MSSSRLALTAVSLVIACSGPGPAGASASDTADTTSTAGTTTTSTSSTTDAAPTTGGTSTGAGSTTHETTTTTTTTDPTTTTGDDTDGVLTRCPQIAPAAQLAIVDDDAISETSGLVESRTQPGVFWLHNDSGDAPRFFAVDRDGARLGEFEVDGAGAIDWEDMSSGPGTSPGEWLYFGDIGDNDEKRASVTVYRVPEPDAAAAAGGKVVVAGVEAIELVYPDQPHNAETLLVDPQTGDLVIVAKGAPTRIFHLPGPVAAGGPHTLAELPDVQFPAVVATGGDISPLGDFIAVRTYSEALLWLRPPGASLADAFKEEPCPIRLASEVQGETLAVAHDGRGYYTLGEGANAPLWWYAFE